MTSGVLTCFLLTGFMCCCGAQVIITQPPGNTTVCRNDTTTISCGYQSNSTFPVTWIINGTSFTQDEIMRSLLYQLNDLTISSNFSLTIFSINGTTTIQCIIQSTPNVTSTHGLINVSRPVVNITTIKVGCGYIFVAWIIENNNICRFRYSTVKFKHGIKSKSYTSSRNYQNLTGVPSDALFNVTVYASNTSFRSASGSPSSTVVVRTMYMQSPTPIKIKANVYTLYKTYKIRVTWEAPRIITSCIPKVTMYRITVMDQYRPASVDVRPYKFYSIISQFSDNGTRVVANKEYTITLSAISDKRRKYTSDPIVVNTFILQNCTVTSPSIGTIRVSCVIPHEIQVTLICTNNCTNRILITYGNSPVIIRGLDHGKRYSVTVNVSNGDQVGLTDQTVMKTVTVNSDSGHNGNNGSDNGGISSGAIVGIAVGGSAAIIIAIIIAISCFIIYRKKGSTSYDDDDIAISQRSPMLQTSKSY